MDDDNKGTMKQDKPSKDEHSEPVSRPERGGTEPDMPADDDEISEQIDLDLDELDEQEYEDDNATR